MDFPKIEQKILKFWQENKIFEKLREKVKGKKRWSFLDGPITANNPMGVHHAWGRTYKDVFQRYKAMQGFNQRFQNGFDCQGLWVEVEVEKELGFKNKKDIEKYGIEKFVQKCKERVLKYSKIQTNQSIRLGQWMDWENSYYTMSDENNYAIWRFLKKCQEKGWLYKGRDVVPWCPRCGTSISQHEILTEEYKELTHKAIFVKYPVVGQDNTYFLVWTTTPWTLPGNVALAVQPDFDYVKVKDKKGNIFILLKEKADLIEDGTIVEEFKGKKLEGSQYEGLFDDLPAVKKALDKYKHSVILWKEVTPEEGTGIVHTAPGCGQEDFQLAKELKLPVIDLTDEESNYRDGFGELQGRFAGSGEVREWVFDNLTKKGRTFKIEGYTHRYPTCWRCKTELIFRLVDEWYISMEGLREPLMKSAKKVKWIPSFGLDRELDWLKNMRDWLISKKRYWGLALPIFECECGNFEVIGSKEELKQRAVEGWQEFEGHSPHRPWVDKVKIKCSKCGAKVPRILDVGTPWLDAGIVPFSTISDDNRADNIPYFQGTKEGKAEWQKWFPVDFITESFPGQFKNWFYVLLVMSQVLEDVPPFKTLFGYVLVVDEKGEEMHKSKGNAIWFNDAVEKIGADVMRWLYVKQNPVYNLRFGYKKAKETARKLLTLWNCYTFYQTYGLPSLIPTRQSFAKQNLGGEESHKTLRLAPQGDGGLTLLDKWMISRLNGLIQDVTKNLDKFDAARASQAIENFFIEDLSLWYIRRSRKRFVEAAPTLYYVLLNLATLLAPILPFFAEEVYQKLKGENMPASVHLCDWPARIGYVKDVAGGPKADEKAIDKDLENKMAQVREIVAKALAKRTELGIKVRQPLTRLSVIASEAKQSLKDNKELLNLIKEEVNVKRIVFDDKIKEEVELDTKITKELKEEGQVREIIRHIQDLRKKAGLKPKDKALIYYSGSSLLGNLITGNKKQILEQTRSKDARENTEREGEFARQKDIRLDGEDLWLAISPC